MAKKFNLDAKIKAALRKLSMQWPAIGECRRNAKNICSECGEWNPKLQVDHIAPVVDPLVPRIKGYTDWNKYIPRLFCGGENLRPLCYSCHKAKK